MIKRLPIKMKMIRNKTNPKQVRFQGYSGDAVNLSDIGFDAPVVYDLKTTRVANKGIVPINEDHETKVGQTTEVNNNKSNIFGEGEITEDNDSAKRILNADKPEASIGLDTSKAQFEFHPKGFQANNRVFKGPHYLIKNAVIDEISATERGRDRWTGFKILNSDLKRIKNSMPKEKKPTPTPAPEPVKEQKVRKKIKNQTPPPGGMTAQDVAQLMRLQNQYTNYSDFITEKLELGWSINRITNAVRLKNAEDNLPKPPQTDKFEGVDLLEARLLGALCKEPEIYLEKKYGPKVRDRVMNMEPIGLHETMVLSARRLGGSFTGHSDVYDMARWLGQHNLGRIQNTAHSSFSMPNLFERVTKFTVEETWNIRDFMANELCYEKSHDNFKTAEGIRPSGGQMWQGLDAEGRIKHGYFGKETRYTSELDTVAQMVMFNREIIENDELSMIKEMITLMLEGGQMVPDYKLVQRMLQANGSFFVAGTNHFAYSLTESNLFLAYQQLEEMTINKGSVDWKQATDDQWWLIVPTLEMEKTAWEILGQAQFVSNTTANTKQGRDNWWYQRFTVKKFRQLANTSMHEDASSNVWFLYPKSKKYAPFSMSTLRGRKTPITRTVEAPVDMLGFGIVGILDTHINDREKAMIIRCDPDTDFTS